MIRAMPGKPRIDLPPKRDRRSSLLRLGDSFELDGVRLPGFPCPIDSKGGLMLPAIDYLTERAVYQRVSMGTLVQEAYILREWLAFCEARHRSWTKPNDKLLADWRSHLEHARVGRREQDPEAWWTNARKLNVVHAFYFLMQHTLRVFETDVIGDPGRDDGQERPVTAVATHLDEPGTKRRGKAVVLNRVRYGNKPEVLGGRPTPRPDEVIKVIDAAGDRPTAYAASTHYLMARCHAQAGLRAIGVCGLKVAALAEGLRADRIGATGFVKRPEPVDLHAAATAPKEQDGILAGLAHLEEGHRTHIFVQVTEKRQVTRSVAMPIALLRELLGYIWDERFRLLEGRGPKIAGGMEVDEVFVSPKSMKAYAAKSVSNIGLAAFRVAGVAGSGHRLRAAYAEEVVRNAYMRARATHGNNYDAAAIMLIVRESLGHRDIKYAEAYLNQLMAEENLVPGEPVLVRDVKLAPSVKLLVDELNKGDPNVEAMFHEMLGKFPTAVASRGETDDPGGTSGARRSFLGFRPGIPRAPGGPSSVVAGQGR